MSNNKTMKVCPNGHYYQGEECPYCEMQNNRYKEYKVCKNNHIYETKEDRCPYCSSKEYCVIRREPLERSTMIRHEIEINNGESVTLISKNDDFLSVRLTYITVSISLWNGLELKHDYRINNIYINPYDIVHIGSYSMTAKEFYKMCDVILDNDIATIVTRKYHF